jgi:hypothetical protein
VIDPNDEQGRVAMKNLALIAITAILMIVPFGGGAASGSRAAETPECCQKKQDCCPSAPCCKGGSHAMGAHCSLHAAAR